MSTLSQKSATVAENRETTATVSLFCDSTVALFCDSLTFLRQCGQALRKCYAYPMLLRFFVLFLVSLTSSYYFQNFKSLWGLHFKGTIQYTNGIISVLPWSNNWILSGITAWYKTHFYNIQHNSTLHCNTSAVLYQNGRRKQKAISMR